MTRGSTLLIIAASFFVVAVNIVDSAAVSKEGLKKLKYGNAYSTVFGKRAFDEVGKFRQGYEKRPSGFPPHQLDRMAYQMSFGKRSGDIDANAFRMSFGKRQAADDEEIPQLSTSPFLMLSDFESPEQEALQPTKRMDSNNFFVGLGK